MDIIGNALQIMMSGGDIELTGINITENGTYTPPSGKAYGRVDVSVITPAVISPLTVTENGTYTVPTGIDGYSPVTVNVPVGAEIITRSAWDAMTTAEKQSKGLVAIQDTVTGFSRGVLVNGADYRPMPEIMYAGSKQNQGTEPLSYTFDEAGTYQIIMCAVSNGDVPRKENLVLNLNGETVSCSYSYPTENNNIALNIYTCEIDAEIGDTISTDYSDSTRYQYSGIQLFVMKNVDVDSVELYDSAANASTHSGFPINTNGVPYLQVAKFGYYNTSVLEFYEVNNVAKNSEVVDAGTKYWYGGSYVLLLQ